MNKPFPPFTCTHSPNIPELLSQLGCTIAISTYQAGKVIFISAKDQNHLVQLPRNFDKAMGLAIDQGKLAIATKDEVVVLTDAPQMAPNYPNQKNTYDALYLPRLTYYTGALDIHDLEWVNGQLWGVNTLFSCIMTMGQDHSFTPIWKPPFVKDYAPRDYCHLNGLAMENGQPRYATALGATSSPEAWRQQKNRGGVMIDIRNNNIVCGGLPMPHSPRLIDGELYVLLSAIGVLARIDRIKGTYEIVKELNGFVRGMARYSDYLFIGLSKLRQSSTAFKDLPISERSVFSGITILHIPTMSIVGHIKYETSVEEIYDVKIIPGVQRPGLLNHKKKDHKMAITSPVGDFWVVDNQQTSAE